MLPLVAIEFLPCKISMSATSRKQMFNLSNFEDMRTEINFSGEAWTRLKRRRVARNRGFRNIFRSRKDILRRALPPSISYFSCTIRWFAANLRPEGSPVSSPDPFPFFRSEVHSGDHVPDGLSRASAKIPACRSFSEPCARWSGSLPHPIRRYCKLRRCVRALEPPELHGSCPRREANRAAVSHRRRSAAACHRTHWRSSKEATFPETDRGHNYWRIA